MAASWQAVTGDLVPLALVVALSPFSVIPPLLLVLHAPRPRPTGLAFGLGWLLGLGASTAVFLALPRAFDGTQQGAASGYVRLGMGAALVLAGLVRWATRHRASRSPAWLNGLAKVGPATALALGVVLPVVNPKFLLANAAAGFGIGSAGWTVPGAWAAVLGYTVLAGSTAVVPIVVYAAAPSRFDRPLERLKDWIERRHAELTAVILVVIGIVLLYQGFRAS